VHLNCHEQIEKTSIILDHICVLSLDKHAATMMGIMKNIKTIPWPHICIELGTISSTNSGLIKMINAWINIFEHSQSD